MKDVKSAAAPALDAERRASVPETALLEASPGGLPEEHAGLEPPPVKGPAPSLWARAPRPRPARIRRPVVQGVVIGAAGLVAGAMAWAFVIQPDLREAAREGRRAASAEGPPVQVRPPEQITARPASYDRLPQPAAEGLPPPRIGGPRDHPDASTGPLAPVRAGAVSPTASAVGAPAEAANDRAPASDLFFGGAAATPRREPNLPFLPSSAAPQPPPLATTGTVKAASLHGPALLAGTVIPGTLLTAVDTARPGPVVAMVSENVFDSVTGRRLALPQGSRLIGRHEGRGLHGDRRAFLVWDRVILPDGSSFALGEAPGVDEQGAVGLSGRTDRRIGPLAVASLFAGALTTLGEIARGRRSDERVVIVERAGDAAAIEATQVGGRLIDRELQVRPSVRIEPGAPLRVLLVRDLVLES